MHSRKFLLAFLIAALVISLPVMASGAAEKIPALQEQGIIPSSVGPLVPDYGTVDTSSLESRFSYAYGYMITHSLLHQNVSIEDPTGSRESLTVITISQVAT